MDGFTQAELDQEALTYELAYEAAYAQAMDEGCSDREADLIAEAKAHLAICAECAAERDERTPRMAADDPRRDELPPF